MTTMRTPSKVASIFLLITVCNVAAYAETLQLITLEESNLPAGTATKLRGPFAGPVIEVVTPPSDVAQKTPVKFFIRFKSLSGSAVDIESVRLIYIKTPLIELTERVRPFITPTGIQLSSADVPPGDHLIRIQLKDAVGRTAAAYANFSVRQ